MVGPLILTLVCMPQQQTGLESTPVAAYCRRAPAQSTDHAQMRRRAINNSIPSVTSNGIDRESGFYRFVFFYKFVNFTKF